MSPRAALVLGVVAVLLVAAEVPLDVASHGIAQGIVVLPFGVVGFVVARRQSRNPIGWILLALTLAFLLSADGGSYAILYYHQGHRGLPLARVGAFLAAWWIWLLLLLPLPIGLFPEARLSRRWRWVVWAYLAVAAFFVAANTWTDATGIVARHIQVDSQGELVSAGSGGSAVKAVGAFLYVQSHRLVHRRPHLHLANSVSHTLANVVSQVKRRGYAWTKPSLSRASRMS